MNVDDKNNQQSQPQPSKNDSGQNTDQDKNQPAEQKSDQVQKSGGSTTPSTTPAAPTPPTSKESSTPATKNTQSAAPAQPSGNSKQQNSNNNKKAKENSGKEITPESFSGAGAAFNPSKSAGSKTPPKPNSKPGSSSKQTASKSTKKFEPKKNKKKLLFILLAVLILVIGGGVTYYLVKMREEPVPTAPPSIPEAEEPAPCTLEFTVLAPTPEPSPTPEETCIENATLTVESSGDSSSIITATANTDYTNVELRVFRNGGFTPYRNPEADGIGPYQWTWSVDKAISDIDSVKFYVGVDPDASREDWGASGELCGSYSPELSPTPSPTPEPNECGASGCTDDTDCSGELICISALDGSNYCSMPEYQNACTANPSAATCCSEPTATPTPVPPTSTPEPDNTSTPTQEPENTSTPTPQPTQVTTVDTTTECNDSCTTNADCDNISHICYNGRCRLDINPEDESCRTPQGETTVERIVEQPVAGPSEWLDFLRVGVGAIGAGLLLLLLL